MKKVIGFLVMLHAGYSLSNYRKFLNFTHKSNEFTIPIDILCELLIGMLLNVYFGVLSQLNQFEDITEFKLEQSYDASISRPNFKNYWANKSDLIKPYLQKQKLQTL